MTTYHLSLSQYKTQKRQKSIILSVCFTRTQRRTIPTGVHVLENQWDKVGERVIRHSGAAVLNAQLADIRKKMSAHLARHTFLTHIEAKPGNVFTVMSLGGAEGGRPHGIRRNATGPPPRIPRKMDTAMNTSVWPSKTTGRLWRNRWQAKNAKTRANSIIATRSSIAVA